MLDHGLQRGGSVRSPVGDRARSRVRREDVGDGSAAEDGGAHRFDGERCEEDPLARAQDDRVDEKAVLIDQAGLDQRSGEPCPALGEQVSISNNATIIAGSYGGRLRPSTRYAA
jgi:hypothetical protein